MIASFGRKVNACKFSAETGAGGVRFRLRRTSSGDPARWWVEVGRREAKLQPKAESCC